jgi:hypothetical protein
LPQLARLKGALTWNPKQYHAPHQSQRLAALNRDIDAMTYQYDLYARAGLPPELQATTAGSPICAGAPPSLSPDSPI